jgi:mRNA-degrading endonuclease YafQ of YafQ-DinJ toxin-antitoxin module
MKYHPITTSKFAKDYARIKKRGKNLEKLKMVVDILLSGEKIAVHFPSLHFPLASPA